MIGWLDCSSGVSGDMLLGAMVGAGVPLAVLSEAVTAVAPEPVELRPEPVTRASLAAIHVQVRTADSADSRTWADVRQLLVQAPLAPPVRDRALAAFAALAAAEAKVHATTPESVHFHEVGALDAIADVVGVCAGMEHLGLTRLTCSMVRVGGGTVRAAHGTLPVPAPAVVELLRGVPSAGGPVDVELCTPTGAALVTTLASDYGPQPAMAVERVGIGAGSRDTPGRPNVVRLLVGAPVAVSDESVARVVAANVDDLDPRLWPAVLQRLLQAGASDAWLSPILMKKGRPAYTVSVLTGSVAFSAVLDVLFTETTTIGVRVHEVAKLALDRQERTVEVRGHSVRVKLATYAGAVVNAQPEYEDVAAVASATGLPAKTILAAATAAARELQ